MSYDHWGWSGFTAAECEMAVVNCWLVALLIGAVLVWVLAKMWWSIVLWVKRR